MVNLVDLNLVVGKAVTASLYYTTNDRLNFRVWRLMYPSPLVGVYNNTLALSNKNHWRKVNKSGRKLFITGVRGTRC